MNEGDPSGSIIEPIKGNPASVDTASVVMIGALTIN